MVYNHKTRSLDLGNLKATDYKYNKDLYMPDPDSPDVEALHQFRRTEANRLFSRAQKSLALDIKLSTQGPKQVSNTNTKFTHRTEAPTNPESNLIKEEL